MQNVDDRSSGIKERYAAMRRRQCEVLPGRTRAELETILGPSLDTAYFNETGRDLIYVLGPQRNSYFPMFVRRRFPQTARAFSRLYSRLSTGRRKA